MRLFAQVWGGGNPTGENHLTNDMATIMVMEYCDMLFAGACGAIEKNQDQWCVRFHY